MKKVVKIERLETGDLKFTLRETVERTLTLAQSDVLLARDVAGPYDTVDPITGIPIDKLFTENTEG